jgi:hypothetical protein
MAADGDLDLGQALANNPDLAQAWLIRASEDHDARAAACKVPKHVLLVVSMPLISLAASEEPQGCSGQTHVLQQRLH